MREGQEAQFEVVVNATDIDRFADLSGDCSSIHCSKEFAGGRGFPDRVAHGMLIGAYVSRFIGMELPGEHGLLQTVSLKFHRPCFPGDRLRVQGCIEEKFDSVQTVVLDIRVTRGADVIASAKVQSGVLK